MDATDAGRQLPPGKARPYEGSTAMRHPIISFVTSRVHYRPGEGKYNEGFVAETTTTATFTNAGAGAFNSSTN